jgi:NADH:ubiquinone oxidoreductase subunit 5 (subunit L)/multisubunit Na+/H+ antiporter MnhA subunit
MIMGGSLLASIYVFRVVSRLLVVPVEQNLQASLAPSPLLEWPAFVLAMIALLLGLVTPYPMHILASDTVVTHLAQRVEP